MNEHESLEYQRVFLAATLEHMNAAVVACNEKGELTLFNRLAREWHGLDPLNIPQTQWADHYNLYMEDGLTIMDTPAIPLLRAFRGETLQDVSMVIAAKNKPKRHILAHATPIKLEDGRIFGAIAVMHDITDRRRVEETLVESEERYRRLMESTTDYIYTVYVKNGKAVETIHGPGCSAVTGYSSEEYKNDTHLWYRMIHADDRDRVVDTAQCVLKGLKIEPIEHRIYHRDGSIRWLRNTIVPKNDDLKGLISYDGLVVDVTARKQAEEALIESEKRFSTIFRVNPVGVALTRMSDNKLVDVNNTFCEILGYSEEEIVGHTSRELGLWLDPQERERIIFELRKNGQGQQIECKFCRKSGEIRDLVISVGLIVIASQEHLLFVGMDITDKKRVQQKLEEAAEEWERTFDAIRDMIFIQDKDMYIMKVNKACAETLKMDPKDIVGKKCHGLMHQMDHSWPGCPFEKTKFDKKVHTEEVNDPSLGISLLITVSPIFDPNGEFIGAVHIAKDVTEMKKVEKQKQEHLHELEIFYKGSIGREERILELKDVIFRLNAELASFKKNIGN